MLRMLLISAAPPATCHATAPTLGTSNQASVLIWPTAADSIPQGPCQQLLTSPNQDKLSSCRTCVYGTGSRRDCNAKLALPRAFSSSLSNALPYEPWFLSRATAIAKTIGALISYPLYRGHSLTHKTKKPPYRISAYIYICILCLYIEMCVFIWLYLHIHTHMYIYTCAYIYICA